MNNGCASLDAFWNYWHVECPEPRAPRHCFDWRIEVRWPGPFQPWIRFDSQASLAGAIVSIQRVRHLDSRIVAHGVVVCELKAGEPWIRESA